MARRLAAALLVALLAACADGAQTLRSASTSHPAIRAQIVRPEGPGPFPAVVIVHGCAGPRQPNYAQWAEFLRAEGFLVATPDLFGPRGYQQTCTSWPVGFSIVGNLFRDTHDAVRILQTRPDVQPERVFVLGFSHGNYVAALAMTNHWDLLTPAWETAPPRLRGAIGVYGGCPGVPSVTHGPLLIVAASLDDWTPAEECRTWVRSGWRSGVRPRQHVIEGAHHGFDNPANAGIRYNPAYFNPNRPAGFGATVGYSREATEEARREVLAFLNGLR